MVFRQTVQLGGFDIHGMPVATEACREPCRDAHQFFATAVMADAQQDAVSGVPDFFTPLVIAEGPHLIVNAVGGTA
ncbi:hypothetical protein D3C77_718960 [compost metagenome]